MIYKIITLTFIISIFSLNIAFADQTEDDFIGPPPPSSNTQLSNPLGDNVSIPILIGRVINSILGIVGSIALAMFVYGGIVMMTSAGNDQRVATGKNVLIWATLGLLVILTSFVLVRFIIGVF